MEWSNSSYSVGVLSASSGRVGCERGNVLPCAPPEGIIVRESSAIEMKKRGVTDESLGNSEPSDNILLQSYLDGDESAFARLVERYRQEVYSFLARFLGDAALADDVFQETFLQLHLSAEKFDMSRRLKPWLFTIAANKARDAMRKRSRRLSAPLDAQVGNSDQSVSYGDLMPSDIPPPLETITNQETRLAVQKIVAQMPEALRLVLVLCYFNGMAYKDIAEVVKAPLGTVKSRLHTAVKTFAEKWKRVAARSDHEH